MAAYVDGTATEQEKSAEMVRAMIVEGAEWGNSVRQHCLAPRGPPLKMCLIALATTHRRTASSLSRGIIRRVGDNMDDDMDVEQKMGEADTMM